MTSEHGQRKPKRGGSYVASPEGSAVGRTERGAERAREIAQMAASEHGSERCGGSGTKSKFWNDPRGPEFNNSPDSTAGGSMSTCPGCPDCEPVPGEETELGVDCEYGCDGPCENLAHWKDRASYWHTVGEEWASRLSLAEKRAEEAERILATRAVADTGKLAKQMDAGVLARAESLATENERLKAALEQIATFPVDVTNPGRPGHRTLRDLDEMRDLARSALTPKDSE